MKLARPPGRLVHRFADRTREKHAIAHGLVPTRWERCAAPSSPDTRPRNRLTAAEQDHVQRNGPAQSAATRRTRQPAAVQTRLDGLYLVYVARSGFRGGQPRRPVRSSGGSLRG